VAAHVMVPLTALLAFCPNKHINNQPVGAFEMIFDLTKGRNFILLRFSLLIGPNDIVRYEVISRHFSNHISLVTDMGFFFLVVPIFRT